jgi:RNA polymerase sigma factor (sigma-70 family)
MSSDPLETLLDRLNDGDVAAAEQVFRACAPVLRRLVRRQLLPGLRSKFDSSDVVQSVWTDLLDYFRRKGTRFASAEHLRAFLVKATRHRFIDYCRQHQGAARERPLPEPDDETLPSAGADPGDPVLADDLWQQLLDLCPPEHHELLRLKREGLPLADIAARTGLHEDSVRRVVRTLARRLALKRDP